ncbi:hypothetical protein JOF29_003129 [Kribbella aluminosa]|uniref:Uncharacterized protein n=1 Tax=Kribbella aluminosa TaxID=416017 RepID=A0ABS4UKI1_9ACTN|nr:hypothetical protein [Kribbella aluminosa]
MFFLALGGVLASQWSHTGHVSVRERRNIDE